jgi:hypothetical protein
MNTNEPFHLLRPALGSSFLADYQPSPLDLPFVRDIRRKRCFWDVATTGRHNEDYLIGISYALETIAYLRKARPSLLLSHVVSAMPRELGPLEGGFLCTLGEFIARP